MSESKSRNSQDFTEGSVPKHLITFAIPLLLGNLLQALYNTVDSIWVGRFLGPQSLAAVSVSFPVIFALVALATGIAMATTTLVAQFSGAKNQVMMRKSVANSVIVMGVLGVFLSILGVIVRRPLLELINTPPDIMDKASSYLSIVLGGTIATFAYNLVSAVMRGVGDSRTPLIYLAYATVINIILDPLMIFGIWPFPAMGVAGAAWATVIAQAISGILGFRHMIREGFVPVGKEEWKLEGRLVRLLFSIGLPAGVQQVIVSTGMLTLTSIVNSFGTIATAAFGVGGRLDQFAFMPAMSVGLSVTALVGQNLGARKFERVHETVRWSAYLSIGISAAIVLFVQLFPGILLKAFTDSYDVLVEGQKYLRIVSLSYIPNSLMFMLGGVLRGAGDTLPTMLISMVTLWVIRIPLAYLFSRRLGTIGIWIGLASSPVIGAFLNWLYFVSGRWKRLNITEVGGEVGNATEAEDEKTGQASHVLEPGEELDDKH